jgi:hypothetical protein
VKTVDRILLPVPIAWRHGVANMVISILITAVLAVLFYSWLRRVHERRLEELRRWAESAGWRVRPAPMRETMPASWPEFPPATWGSPSLSIEGERDGHPLVLEWITSDEWSATVCYAALEHDYPNSTLRRRPFSSGYPPHERFEKSGDLLSRAGDAFGSVSAESWQLSGGFLAAAHEVWLPPTRIDAFLAEVTGVCAAIRR